MRCDLIRPSPRGLADVEAPAQELLLDATAMLSPAKRVKSKRAALDRDGGTAPVIRHRPRF
jgi:hypothetical protein